MLQPGTAVDRYVVDRLLGRGGMASVYAVKHAVLGTRHALKVLHSVDPGLRHRLIREGRVQARLDPRYVVPVTDVIDVMGAAALIMPLVEGCSLDELLGRIRPSEAEVAALIGGVLRGVGSAHAAGVIHRDLKPANVLLEERRGRVEVRVADFGLARPAGEDTLRTHDGVMMGTPAYAAPEQLRDAASVDHRADLWSLGVMLVELLTGVRPFRSESLKALVAEVWSGAYDRSGIPAAWLPVVDRLLQTDPDRRARSAEEVEAAIARVCPAADLVAGGRIAEAVRNREPAPSGRYNLAPTGVLRPTYTDVSFPTVPDTAAPHAPRHNLPTERDVFVGREEDLSELLRRIDGGARLVSVLGIGGTGKTRLTVHFGRRHVAEWPGGVWFCDLSEARAEEGICTAVGRALDVPLGSADAVALLGRAIAARERCLVILDNVEQVVAAAGEVLEAWLDRAPQAVFVATTREVLGVPGEEILALHPLRAEDSVALFRTRAAASRRGFDPDEDALDAIRELVVLLDHLPLAIELAAARVRVLPPRKLLARMADRFRLLVSAGGRRDRHATLQAALDWSWDLLGPAEQDGLAQLSVFEGGFDLEAAEAVLDLDAHPDAPWAMDLVQALVDKSLVRAVGDDRFTLLVSVQDYATRKLAAAGGTEAAHVRHGAWYGGFGTTEAVEAVDRHGGIEARQERMRDLANFVAACRRAVARGDGDVAALAVWAAWPVLDMAGPYPLAADLASAVLDLPSITVRDRSDMHRILAIAQGRLGQKEASLENHRAALALAREAGDKRIEASVLGNLGAAALGRGRIEEADALLRASVALHREVGNDRAYGIVASNLGMLRRAAGRLDEAVTHLEAALEVHRRVGNRRSEGVVLGNLGVIRAEQGDLVEAQRLLRAALAVHRESLNRRAEANVRSHLATLLLDRGAEDHAAAQLQAALVIAREVGASRTESLVRGHLAWMEAGRGRRDAAREHADAALALHRKAGDRRLEGRQLGLIGDLLAEDEQIEAARERWTEGEARLRAVGDLRLLAVLLARRAAREATTDPTGAHERLAEARRLAQEVGSGPRAELGQALEAAERVLSPRASDA